MTGAGFHDIRVLCPGSEHLPDGRIELAGGVLGNGWCPGCEELRGVRQSDGLIARHYVTRKDR